MIIIMSDTGIFPGRPGQVHARPAGGDVRGRGRFLIELIYTGVREQGTPFHAKMLSRCPAIQQQKLPRCSESLPYHVPSSFEECFFTDTSSIVDVGG